MSSIDTMKLSHEKIREKRRISTKHKIVLWVVFALFLIYAFTIIYPFVWATLTSLRDRDSFGLNPLAFPDKFMWSNYVRIFDLFIVNGVGLGNMFFNSIVYTALGTLFSTVSSTVAAYCIGKYKFHGKNLLYSIAIFTMIIPVVGAMPATYQLLTRINFKDNLVLISLLWGSGFGFNFLLLFGFFKSISWSYAEAAHVDGAGHFRVFWSVMLPQAKPALIAVAIITSIGVWNDYLTPFLYLENMPTLSYGLYEFEITARMEREYPLLFAGIMISTLPLLIIFIAFQKTIIENTVAGGLKG